MVGNVVVLLDELFAERLDQIDRRIGGEADMAARAVRRIAGEFDDLLADSVVSPISGTVTAWRFSSLSMRALSSSLT